MNSKRLPKRSLMGIRVCTTPGLTGISHAGNSNLNCKTVATRELGIILACKDDPASGCFTYALRLDDGTLKERRGEDIILNGIDLKSEEKEKHPNCLGKIPISWNSEEEDGDGVSCDFQKRSPTHRLDLGGKKLEDPALLESRCIVRRAPEFKRDPLLQGLDLSLDERCLQTSSHIPVPRHSGRSLTDSAVWRHQSHQLQDVDPGTGMMPFEWGTTQGDFVKEETSYITPQNVL